MFEVLITYVTLEADQGNSGIIIYITSLEMVRNLLSDFSDENIGIIYMFDFAYPNSETFGP